MNTLPRLALLALLIPALSLRADDTKKSKEDLDKLQGTWQVTKGVNNGREAAKDAVDESKLTFKGDVLTYDNGRESNAAKVSLDAGKKPRQFDSEVLDGNDKGKKRLAIYELDGDTLKICFTRGGDRPTKFESKEGQDALYLELKRKKN